MSTEIRTRYDDLPQCADSAVCEFVLTLERRIYPPVFVYYELDNFYQNHRQYVKSRDNKQLLGVDVSLGNATNTCGEVVDMEDIGRNTSVGGLPLSPTTVANPCGLVAKSLFNGTIHTDTYALSYNSSAIFLNQTDIAWKSDRKFIFNRNEDYLAKQWVDVEDEHFQVWMRTALLPRFRKLWARIEEPINPGEYTVRVANNYNVSEWHGKKFFVLSTANSLGGTTQFLGYLLIAGAGGCLLIILMFVVKSRFTAIPTSEDLDNLHWD